MKYVYYTGRYISIIVENRNVENIKRRNNKTNFEKSYFIKRRYLLQTRLLQLIFFCRPTTYFIPDWSPPGFRDDIASSYHVI